MNGATNEQIEYMVQRFLQWKIPNTFSPDGGISFQQYSNKATPYEHVYKPVGTNLFDYTEAKAMVEHMLHGLPNAFITELNVDAALDAFYGPDKTYTIAELDSARKKMRAAIAASMTEIKT
jgi:hypothetical protein